MLAERSGLENLQCLSAPSHEEQGIGDREIETLIKTHSSINARPCLKPAELKTKLIGSPGLKSNKRKHKKRGGNKANQPSFKFALPSRTGRQVRCLHQNANGLRARLKDGSFFKTLEEQTPDVIAITEARCTRHICLKYKNTRTRLRELGYLYTAFNATRTNVGYAGVAVISKLPFSSVELDFTDVRKLPRHPPYSTDAKLLEQLQQEARVLIAEFGHFNLAVVYSPNSGKPGELTRLPKRIEFEELLQQKLSQLDMPCILVGDLNTVRDTADASGGLQHPRYVNHPGCTPEERALFEQLIARNHFVDMQRQQGVPGHTYQSSRGYSLRLDYVLAHESIANYTRDFKHIVGMGSDHSGQTFCIDKALFDIDPCPLSRAKVGSQHVNALLSSAELTRHTHTL